MANILVLTQGTGGDLHPFIRISCELNRRGHRVTLITHGRFADEVHHYGLEFAPLDRPERVERLKVLQTPEGMAELLSKTGTADQLVFGACMDVYDSIAKRSIPGETMLVSNHNLNLITQMAAEQLRLLYVPVFTAPYFLLKLTMLEQFYRADAETLNGHRAELGLPPIHDWGAWLRHPRWQIGLWPAWYAAADKNDGSTQVTAVGFIANPGFETGALPADVNEFLGAGDAPVLIAHGTSRPYRPEFFTAAIEACAMLGLRALVVTRHDDLVPERLPPGSKRCDYLPFGSVLGRVGALVHHGGIGTLHQALVAAVPQLVQGYVNDGPHNGQQVQRLGVGAYLPPVRWRAETVAAALSRLLTTEVRARCASLARRLRESPDATTTACDLIEKILIWSQTSRGPQNDQAPALSVEGEWQMS